MPRLGRRIRDVLLFIIVATVLIGVGTGVRWGRSRFFPELGAETRAAYFRGDWARIAHLARERLKNAPDDTTALRLAARAAAHQDRDQTAIAIYNQLVVGDLDAEDFYLLGRALGRTGQTDAAFKAYETARLGNPDHPETLYALAQLYLQNDRENAAEETGERLVRQPGWEARGQLVLGQPGPH